MYFPISISRTSPFLILGVLGGTFHCYSNSNRIFCEQTVETLIRRRVLRRLIWVCVVCQCPTKRTLDLYGLSFTKSSYANVSHELCCDLLQNNLKSFNMTIKIKYEPWHGISNNVVCATRKASDQPAHTRSLIRAFASRLNIL